MPLFDTMAIRPEYIDAVNAVRWSWSLWLIFLAPPTVIWLTRALPKGQEKRFAIGSFALAVMLCLGCADNHASRVDFAKALHFQTKGEELDWEAGTWLYWKWNYSETAGTSTISPGASLLCVFYCDIHQLAMVLVLRKRTIAIKVRR